MAKAPAVHFLRKLVEGAYFARPACSRSPFHGAGQLREGTTNPAEVTCERCKRSPAYRKAVARAGGAAE